MGLVIRRMEKRDIPQVVEIEKLCFTEPWSEADYKESLLLPYASYYVAEFVPQDSVGTGTAGPAFPEQSAEAGGTAGDSAILGMCGLRLILDEGEITNVAVRPAWRGQGIARLMLANLLEEGRRAGGTAFTLGVRAGNAPAIALYEGLGFRYEARRPGFYTKPVEDALLYWLKD